MWIPRWIRRTCARVAFYPQTPPAFESGWQTVVAEFSPSAGPHEVAETCGRIALEVLASRGYHANVAWEMRDGSAGERVH